MNEPCKIYLEDELGNKSICVCVQALGLWKFKIIFMTLFKYLLNNSIHIFPLLPVDTFPNLPFLE